MPEQEYSWITVDSSMVQALCFVASGKIERSGKRRPEPFGALYVAFNTGRVAMYPGVTQHDFSTIREAKSVGGALTVLLTSTRAEGRGFRYVGRLEEDALKKGRQK